jgi:predicted phosphoribosyltransferase
LSKIVHHKDKGARNSGGKSMSCKPLFSDRTQAGEQLAQFVVCELERLKEVGISAQPIVYALPRGGIPVAVPVARQLGCPVEIVVAKKITRPENPELAIGAVTADGQIIWSGAQLWQKNQSSLQQEALHQAQSKAQAQWLEFSRSCPQANPQGAIAILVDDGIATGMTMAVAAHSLKAKQPAQVWIATPVAPPELIKWLQQWGDRIIVLHAPYPFLSVSRFYEQFPQLETDVALAYLQQHNCQWQGEVRE